METKIKIPFKTPTINHLYWHKGNMKIMKTEAKKLRKEIVQICKEVPLGHLGPYEQGLKVITEIYENWRCKDGSIKKKDVANREKFLIDSVFEGLEIDDKFILEQTIRKVQSVQEFAVVTINPISSNGRTQDS